mgnify:CR=1 FL=1
MIMRLDKYVASVTELSRNDAKKAIRSGRVNVAGQVQRDPKFSVEISTRIKLDGDGLRGAGKRYIMLNKPKGYVCATKDREHLTVLELLEVANCEQLHIAGRLDLDTTGLVLITDDGQWSHRVTSPHRDCKKTYLVETADPISADSIVCFEKGFHLENEKRPTLPAHIEIVDEHTARLTISEGRYHQVKRMFGAMGNKVDCLHRERIGDIFLDANLSPGEYRNLSTDEIASV